MPKREPSSSPTSEFSLHTPEPKTEDDVKPSPSKKTKRGKDQTTEKKSSKTAWTPTEDAILISMLDDLIKSQIWNVVKLDGRLNHRGSYGVQYHAKMLLRQGTGQGPSKAKKE